MTRYGEQMKSEHILRYTSPAADFNEALPIGNGRIGGMVYGGPDKDLVGLNEDSVWSGGLRNRVNPDAKEGLKEVRELLLAGNMPEKKKTAMEKMAGVSPNSRHYMPLGNLMINMCPGDDHGEFDTDGYLRTLDLSEAVSSVCFSHDGVKYTREYFVSAPDNVLVVRFSASESGQISFDAELDGRDDYYDDNRPVSENVILSCILPNIRL